MTHAESHTFGPPPPQGAVGEVNGVLEGHGLNFGQSVFVLGVALGLGIGQAFDDDDSVIAWAEVAHKLILRTARDRLDRRKATRQVRS